VLPLSSVRTKCVELSRFKTESTIWVAGKLGRARMRSKTFKAACMNTEGISRERSPEGSVVPVLKMHSHCGEFGANVLPDGLRLRNCFNDSYLGD
jgi:hypothetical protein